MVSESYKIVGTYYRKGGNAILGVLGAGFPLILRPEPTNLHDPNAIAVLVNPNDIAKHLHAQLEVQLPGYGLELGELLAAGEFHLGYVKKEQAAELAPKLGGQETRASLCFASDGAPQAKREKSD